MSNHNETLELMYQKRDIVTQLLNLTKDISFIGTEQDVHKYIELVDARENYINKIKEIDAVLSKEPHTIILQSSDNNLQEELTSIKAQMKEEITLLANIENKNKPYIQKTKDIATGFVKDINLSKNIKNIYARQDVPTYTKIDTTQ